MIKFISVLLVVLSVLSVMLIGNRLFSKSFITSQNNIYEIENVLVLMSSEKHECLIPIEEIVEEIVEDKIEVTEQVFDSKIKEYPINEKDVVLLSKLVWGEAMGLNKFEQSAVIWCVLNRVDSNSKHFPDTIKEVILQPNQFSGYHKWCPVRDDIKELVIDVLTRWCMEKDGAENVGRTLPKNYYYFRGFQKHNWFFTTEEYHKGKYERNYWDWSLANPYV